MSFLNLSAKPAFIQAPKEKFSLFSIYKLIFQQEALTDKDKQKS